jgi:penicillin-binding protein 1B
MKLPPVLVNAILAAEDHRFFSHHGVNMYRILGAAVADIRADEQAQGGSTLTMQLARNFFLTRRRTFRRKVEEIFLALLMEQRLSKQQIFELYANQTYLGQRGSFSIYGFGEAANAYFNKDVRSLHFTRSRIIRRVNPQAQPVLALPESLSRQGSSQPGPQAHARNRFSQRSGRGESFQNALASGKTEPGGARRRSLWTW